MVSDNPVHDRYREFLQSFPAGLLANFGVRPIGAIGEYHHNRLRFEMHIVRLLAILVFMPGSIFLRENQFAQGRDVYLAEVSKGYVYIHFIVFCQATLNCTEEVLGCHRHS